MDSQVWSDPNYLKLWMYCLMKASHKDREVLIGNQLINLEPGQFITGRKSLAEDLNQGVKPKYKQSEISWWRYLNNLENMQMLNIKKTNKYSVISINKWNEYQENEQQMNNKRTSNEHQMNTNKNVKNVKNDKKLISSSSADDFSKVLTFYRDNLQRGLSESPFNMELISQWFDEWGGEILLAAMKVSAKAEAKGVNFTEGVLKKWKEAGVRTIEDARKYEMEFKAKGKKNNVLKIPNYEKGDSGEGSNEQHPKERRHVRLFK